MMVDQGRWHRSRAHRENVLPIDPDLDIEAKHQGRFEPELLEPTLPPRLILYILKPITGLIEIGERRGSI